jgi:hypothetical protein
MVWSIWKGAAVLAGLGSIGLVAGLVYSQQPRASSSAPDPTQIVTIQEVGKPAMECVILKSYRTADGQLAHDVRVLSTGERMTFIDGNVPPAKGKQPGVWNKGTGPAEYIEERFVNGPNATPAGKSQPLPAAKGPEEFRTIQEAGKPAQKCRVMARWKMPDGSPACQMQAIDSGEILTIVETGPVQNAPGAAKSVATRIYHWGKNTTRPAGVPVPPPVQEPAIAATPAAPVQQGCSVCGPQVTVEQPKPTIGERVKDTFSNLMPNRNSTPVAVTPKPIEVPPPPVTAKSDAKIQWSSGDSGVTSFGKPAVDGPAAKTTTASTTTSALPLLPAAQATGNVKMPVLPPIAGSASTTTPLPLVPAALATGDTKMPVLPPLASGKPSLPPGSTLPSTRTDTSSDPLAVPEKFSVAGKSVVEMSTPGSEASTQLPPGAGSVMAAANGTGPSFMPVPMVTMPQARPPMPPAADLPKAPTKAPDPTWYVNAFTPPLPPNAVSEQMLMAQRQQQMQQMQMMAMMQAGYAVPMPMGYAPVPYGQMTMGGPGRGMVPLGYQGPIPPNPVASMPMMPQGYPAMVPMMPVMPVQPAGYANPAMDRPGMPMGPLSLQQKINILQTSIYPTTREEAVISLCEGDYCGHPQVVQLLMRVAKDDPAPTVRAACVSGLARMNVTSEPMMQTLNTLKSDSDPRVRQAVEEAMSRLSPSRIQPASARQ